jgi:hypothetical protein
MDGPPMGTLNSRFNVSIIEKPKSSPNTLQANEVTL